jgi:pimeloyl-ACP methyl ester carboxylesterase
MKKAVMLLLLLASSLLSAKTEVGELQGVPFRIDIPDNWNHNLVVYYHGYGVAQQKFKEDPLGPVLSEFTKRGYAVIQSAYSKPGWAIAQAIPETESLRQYFVKKYGAPKESYVTGHSMGGFLTVSTMEQFPARYNAGLALCGPLQPAPALLERAFHELVVFNFYFPGLLPPANNISADFVPNEEKVKAVLEEFRLNPQKAAAMRIFARLKSDKEVAETSVFLTYVLKDMQERSGGNPFSNRDTIYTGSPDDNQLNDGVRRYDASASLNYLKANYSFTGKLQRPVLAIHTTYDPLVPAEIPNHYAFLTEETGTGGMFVQQFVQHDGHCNITPAEVGRGFDELLDWTHRNVQPQGGRLTVGAAK